MRVLQSANDFPRDGEFVLPQPRDTLLPHWAAFRSAVQFHSECHHSARQRSQRGDLIISAAATSGSLQRMPVVYVLWLVLPGILLISVPRIGDVSTAQRVSCSYRFSSSPAHLAVEEVAKVPVGAVEADSNALKYTVTVTGTLARSCAVPRSTC